SSTTRRWLLLGSAAAVLTALGVTQAAAGRTASPASPVLPVAAVENADSQTPSVSADGQLVAYSGSPSTPGDERTSTVWLRNRAAHTLYELTTPTPDIRIGNSVWPVVSADGCSVTVITEMAYDLFRDDDGGSRWDVYRLLLPECGGELGDWELVSASRGAGFDASAGDDVSPLYPPAVSDEGSVIAYTHQFGLSAPELSAITVVDLSVPIGDPGRSMPVAGTPAGAPDSTFRYVGLREPAISADGSVLAFTSDAKSSLMLAEWGDGAAPGSFATSDVYLWDRLNLDRNTNVRRLSTTVSGDPGNSYSPTVSGNGEFVAFVSTATSLVAGAVLPACNPDCTPQVYLFDRTEGSLQLASRAVAPATAPGEPAPAPVAADTGATQPALNDSGDELLYVSRATNLFQTRSGAPGGHDDGDIVLFVPSSGAVERVSVLADGVTPAPAANAHPRLSATGRVVVFDTLAGAAYGNPVAGGRQVAIIDHPPTLELANLDVGTVAVAYPGPEWFLVLNNRGPSSFLPALLEVSNPDFLISGGSCADIPAAPVPPGGSCTVNLMLLPSVPGPITGTLTVSEAGFDAVSITSNLTGFGGDPALAPTPGGGYGGSLVVGTRGEPVTFSLVNVAFNPVSITRLRVEGSNPDDFQINLDECSGKTLDAGVSCDLQVIFSPIAGGRRTANIVAVTAASLTAESVYATILVSGDAHFEPKIGVSNTTIIPGTTVTIAGAGYGANELVTLSWADGSGSSFTTVTNIYGLFETTLFVRPNDRAGNRTLVAQSASGDAASADVTILPRGRQLNPGAANWPGR
ncbi:MAG: choice-of-anchor D domain-containing protein, partial [Ilumatobacteraceae bacterium]